MGTETDPHPVDRWALVEPMLKALEKAIDPADPQRRIVCVAVGAAVNVDHYAGEMGGAPVVLAEDGIDAVQWSDGVWQPLEPPAT